MILNNIDSLITIIKEQYDDYSYATSPDRGIKGTLKKYSGDIGAGVLGAAVGAATHNPLVGAGIYGAYKGYDLLSKKHQMGDKTLPASAVAGLAGAGLALKFGPDLLKNAHTLAT
jgi:hypothetical protein